MVRDKDGCNDDGESFAEVGDSTPVVWDPVQLVERTVPDDLVLADVEGCPVVLGYQLFVDVGIRLLSTGCQIVVDWLSDYCRLAVSLLSTGCHVVVMVVVDWLSDCCRLVVRLLCRDRWHGRERVGRGVKGKEKVDEDAQRRMAGWLHRNRKWTRRNRTYRL